jgi:Domain of unknown function (DUF4326)
VAAYAYRRPARRTPHQWSMGDATNGSLTASAPSTPPMWWGHSCAVEAARDHAGECRAMPKVIDLRSRKLRVLLEREEYIGDRLHRRGWQLPKTKSANPFKIGHDGTRDEIIPKCETWLRAHPDLMAALGELRGKDLRRGRVMATCSCVWRRRANANKLLIAPAESPLCAEKRREHVSGLRGQEKNRSECVDIRALPDQEGGKDCDRDEISRGIELHTPEGRFSSLGEACLPYDREPQRGQG